MMKIDSDGNGGTNVNIKAKPNKVKFAISAGIVLTILLTVGSWVYAIGGKNEKFNQVCQNDVKQDVRITKIEEQLNDIEVIKNELKWIREGILEIKNDIKK